MNLYQDVFFRALDLVRGRHNIARLRFLERSQYWPPEQLRTWQLDRLNELLIQARQASEFHRQRLRAVQLPLRDLSELEQLPILTKQEIREHREAIRTDNLPRRRYVPARTGGSTGRPMSYYWDKAAMDWNRGTVYRSVGWAGVALGDPTVEMSGSQFDEAQSRRVVNRLAALLHRHRACSVAWVTDEIHEQYFQLLNRFQPTSIWGYSSGIDLFARHILEHHPGASFPYLRALITSSEMLRPEQRARIERAFGAGKVFDHYGSREMYIASECREHDGYHLHADVVLTEIVGPDGRACAPGERGRVVLTELFNHAFPFLRYEIGDLAVMAPAAECPCGVRLPRLQSVEGRIAELVVLRDRILTPPNFASIFSEMDAVQAYQIRQATLDEVDVLVEPGPGFDHGDREFIARAVDRLVAGQARVRVHTDRPIEIPESGKRRFVVSAVREQDRNAAPVATAGERPVVGQAGAGTGSAAPKSAKPVGAEAPSVAPPSRALRILYHHRTQGRGAESVHIGSIVRALRDLGHEVTVLGPPGVDALATEGQPPVDKSAVRTRGLSRLWTWISRHMPGAFFELSEMLYNVAAWWRLRRVLRPGAFDLVYERYAFYLVAGAWVAQRRGVPFVLEANEVSGLEERARTQVFHGACRRFERALLTRCTGILTVTSYLAGLAVKNGADPARVTVVPNAIGRTLLEPRPERPELVRRYGLEGRCVIGFAGWFDDWDRLDVLVRAIHRLRPQHPQVAALLIGDGPQRAALQAQARELGVEDDVIFTGAVPRAEVLDHMALADIAALPHASLFQSPMVMFEFMACRCPLVAPRVAGVENVLVDGESVLMFERGDEEAFDAALTRLVEDGDLRTRLAGNAYRELHAHHLWIHNAARIPEAAGLAPSQREP